jgi:hypothetical protein
MIGLVSEGGISALGTGGFLAKESPATRNRGVERRLFAFFQRSGIEEVAQGVHLNSRSEVSFNGQKSEIEQTDDDGDINDKGGACKGEEGSVQKDRRLGWRCSVKGQVSRTGWGREAYLVGRGLLCKMLTWWPNRVPYVEGRVKDQLLKLKMRLASGDATSEGFVADE